MTSQTNESNNETNQENNEVIIKIYSQPIQTYL